MTGREPPTLCVGGGGGEGVEKQGVNGGVAKEFSAVGTTQAKWPYQRVSLGGKSP